MKKSLKKRQKMCLFEWTVLFTILLHLAIIYQPAKEEVTRSPNCLMWLFGCKLCRYVCRYGRLSSLRYGSFFFI